MERRFVDATNACRILFTRGDIGRLRRFAAGARLCAAVGFFAAEDADEDAAEAFVPAALCVALFAGTLRPGAL
jgi:hypothetical protein